MSEEGKVSLKSKRRRTLLVSALATCAALGGALVVAVRTVPQAGPMIANSLRAVIGVEAVASLEETAAAAEDTLMRWRWRKEPPRSLHALSVPMPEKDAELGGAVAPDEAQSAAPAAPVFTPPRVEPPFRQVAADGDGQWLPVRDPERPDAPVLMYQTLIHPDPERRWSELFVVAMPTSLVRVAPVPGSEEPSSDNPAAARIPNRGLIPSDARGELLAAFNGGFRAEHGHHGMMVNGVTLLPPRADMCTVAGFDDGTLRIGTYSRLMASGDKPLWYRQSPRCMVEQGALHPGLRDPNAKGWGSTLEGDTVIRRSAIALSEAGDILYVAVTNSTTARALALGMRAVGGHHVAQLDVNFSFPKFLLFPRDEAGVRRAASLFKGFLFEAEEMLEQPAERDFFYVVRRPSGELTASAPAPAQPTASATLIAQQSP